MLFMQKYVHAKIYMQKSKREMDDTDFKNSDFGGKNHDLYPKFYSPIRLFRIGHVSHPNL